MADPLAIAKKDVGPFPVWGWGAIVGTGLALGLGLRWWRSRSAGSSDDGPPPSSDDTTYGYATPKVVTLPAGPTGPVTGPPVIDTNLKWQNEAIKQMVAKGHLPQLVQSGIVKFLRGQAVTAAEAAIVNEAIQLLGPPPGGADPLRIESDQTNPPVGPVDGGGPDVSTYSNVALVDHGNWAYVAPMSGTPIGGRELAKVTTEVLKRAREGRLSVNDPGVWQKDGKPKPVWYHLAPLLNAQIKGAGNVSSASFVGATTGSGAK